MRKGFGPALAVCLLAGIPAAMAVTAPNDVTFDDMKVSQSLTGQPGDPEKGRLVFSDRRLGNCLACHANADMKKELFHGEIGPDLTGVAGRYDETQLRAIVVNAKQVFGERTIMPAFYRIIEGQRVREDLIGKPILTAEQVEDLVAYLTTLK